MMRELQGKMSRDSSPFTTGRDTENTAKSNSNITKDKDDRKLPIKPIVKKNILDFDSDSESENEKLEDYINSSNTANKNNNNKINNIVPNSNVNINNNIKSNTNVNTNVNTNTNANNTVKTLTKNENSNSKESLKSFDSGSSFNIVYGQQEPEGAVSTVKITLCHFVLLKKDFCYFTKLKNNFF